MSRADRRRLERRLDEIVSEAVDLDGDDRADRLAEMREIVQLLDTIDRRHREPRAVTAIVLILSVVVAGLLWTMRVGETRLLLDIASRSVTITPTADWSWTAGRGGMPSVTAVEGADALDGALLRGTVTGHGGEAWLRLEQGASWLQELSLGAGVSIRVDSDDGAYTAHAQGAPADGRIVVSGPAGGTVGTSVVLDGESFASSSPIPETVNFRVSMADVIPLTIRGRVLEEAWLLRDISIGTLAFSRETSIGPIDAHIGSTIVGGQVDLPDVDKTLTLADGDHLSFEGLQGRVVEVRVGDTIRTRFQGSARRAWLGPPGFERALSPTYLEYLRGNKPLAFFWGAAVFIWSLGWGLYRTVRVW